MLVAGEPGLGKTRLLDEAARLAVDRGFAVVATACWEGEGSPPLWPWAQAVRALSERGLTDDTELPGLLTEGEQVGGLLGDVDPAGARFRLFDRVVECVRGASTAQPLLLVVDDLHWADRSSLQLLAQLATALRNARLVVAGAYRDTEVGPALATLLGTLPSDTERVALQGLGRVDVAELASSTIGAPLAGELVEILAEHTAGNPFFVKELVRLLVAQGELGHVGAMPAGVRDVLDRRLARLSNRCHEVLSGAAVIGREFDGALLAAVLGMEPGELADLLDEAIAGRIVVEIGLDRFTFVHDLFRQALDDGLGRARRLRLHLAVGEALEARHRDDLEPHLSELAHHFLESAAIGDIAKAVEYGRRAGARAAGLLAFDEAVDHLRRVHDVDPGAPAAARAALLVDLGNALWRARDIEAARATFLEAAGLARAAGAAEVLARAALGFACGLGGNQPLAPVDRVLIDLLEEAHHALPPDDSELQCRVLARLAVELYLTDDVERRGVLSAHALAMARRLDDPAALAVALYARQIALFGPDGLEERAAAAEEIIAIAADAGDPELALWGQLFRVWAHAERGLPVGDDLVACAQLADALRLPGYQAEVAVRRAVFAMQAGEFAEVERLLGLVHEVALTDAVASASYAALMTLQGLLRGPLAHLEPMVEAMLVEQPDTRLWHGALGVLYAELGRLDEAKRQLDDFAERGFELPRGGQWLFTMYFLAFLCAVTGDAQSAEALHPQLLPHADQSPVGAFGSMATAVALLDAARGRHDDALRWFDTAIERNHATQNIAFEIWTRREKAAALLERGDRAEARALLESVVAEMRARGFDGILVRAEALLAEAAEGTAATTAELRRAATGWLATFAGESAHLAASKGLDDLAVLLAQPGREVAAVDLAGAVVSGDAGELLDARARRQVRTRIEELEEERAEAEANADLERAAAARVELDELAAQLAGAVGLGGRPRRAGDDRERARKAVTWRVRQAIRNVEDAHPALGRHLDQFVRTGAFCVYEPTPPVTWHIVRDR